MNNDMLLGGGGIPNIGGPKLNPLEYPTKKCSCGSILFTPNYIVKDIPGAVVGAAGESIVYPLKVLVCSKCGKILEDDVKMFNLEKDLENNQII